MRCATHSCYAPTMTTDTALLSKSVFEWWWALREARRPVLLRHLPPDLRLPPLALGAGAQRGQGWGGTGKLREAFGPDGLSLEQVRCLTCACDARCRA